MALNLEGAQGGGWENNLSRGSGSFTMCKMGSLTGRPSPAGRGGGRQSLVGRMYHFYSPINTSPTHLPTKYTLWVSSAGRRNLCGLTGSKKNLMKLWGLEIKGPWKQRSQGAEDRRSRPQRWINHLSPLPARSVSTLKLRRFQIIHLYHQPDTLLRAALEAPQAVILGLLSAQTYPSWQHLQLCPPCPPPPPAKAVSAPPSGSHKKPRPLLQAYLTHCITATHVPILPCFRLKHSQGQRPAEFLWVPPPFPSISKAHAWLAPSRYSTNVCWMDRWMDGRMDVQDGWMNGGCVGLGPRNGSSGGHTSTKQTGISKQQT